MHFEVCLKNLIVYFALLTVFAAFVGEANSQDWASLDKKAINQGRVGIISGGVKGTYAQFAADLANVLDEENRLRIVPMLGKGSVQNIFDIRFLDGVDIGIVQSDVLEFIRQQGWLRDIERTIHYITKLYNEEIHILARKEYASLSDLQGRTVNFDKKGSGTAMTAGIVFDTEGVKVRPLYLDQEKALDQLKNGEIDAMVYVAGQPVKIFENRSIGEYARFIPITHTSRWASKSYLPGELLAAKYPGIIPEGSKVETIAVGAVMAVYNWNIKQPRYKKVERFIQSFFSKFDEFQRSPPRHEKWREVSLEAEVVGWVRFKPAANWLETNSSGEDYLSSLPAFIEGYIKKHGMGDLPLDAIERLYRDLRAARGLQ